MHIDACHLERCRPRPRCPVRSLRARRRANCAHGGAAARFEVERRLVERAAALSSRLRVVVDAFARPCVPRASAGGALSARRRHRRAVRRDLGICRVAELEKLVGRDGAVAVRVEVLDDASARASAARVAATLSRAGLRRRSTVRGARSHATLPLTHRLTLTTCTASSCEIASELLVCPA